MATLRDEQAAAIADVLRSDAADIEQILEHNELLAEALDRAVANSSIDDDSEDGSDRQSFEELFDGTDFESLRFEEIGPLLYRFGAEIKALAPQGSTAKEPVESNAEAVAAGWLRGEYTALRGFLSNADAGLSGFVNAINYEVPGFLHDEFEEEVRRNLAYAVLSIVNTAEHALRAVERKVARANGDLS